MVRWPDSTAPHGASRQHSAPDPVKRAPTSWLAPALAALLAVVTLVSQADEIRGEERYGAGERVRVGFFNLGYRQSSSDARAQVKVAMEAVAARRGFEIVIDAVAYEGLATCLEDLRAGRVDIVSLPSQFFVAAEREGLVDPMQVILRTSEPGEHYLLMVRGGSGIETLSDLRGRELVVESNHRTGIARVWLDTVFLEGGSPPASRFFAKVTESGTVTGAVLPVFLRRADACLVNATGFGTAVELNPQLGKELRTLLSSELLVSDILSIRKGYRSRASTELARNLGDLGRDPRGQQLLTFFQAKGLVPFRPEYMTTTRALLERYARVQRSPLALAGEARPVRTATPASTALPATGR